MSVFTPDRTSQLESFCFRIERTVESLASKMKMFSKLATSIEQLHKDQTLHTNSLDSLHKRLNNVELAQKDLKSELGAMNKKLDTIIALLEQKGL